MRESEVRAAFSTEHVYRAQQAVYRTSTGPDARDVLAGTVAALRRGRLLEVGCGEGALSAALAADGWDVVATDLSPRMAQLTRERGARACVAALPRLPFADASVDCVVAAWVLHYLDAGTVPAAIREIRRVLRPGGTLVAATNADRHMAELWRRLPAVRYRLSFAAEHAPELLAAHGAEVTAVPVEGTVVFESYEQAKAFVTPQVRPATLADTLEPFDGRLPVTRRAAVLRATFPAR